MTDIVEAGRERPTLEERQAEGGQIEKLRLTTSAMIASLAAEGQPTSRHRSAMRSPRWLKPARDRRADGRLEQVHRPLRLRQAYPDRYYQMGMAEQLLMSAAGMAREGFLPLPPPTPFRIAASLRLHLSCDRRGEPERQDRLRAAGADDRLRTEPPGYR